jgi:phosphohistidine phosphatase SixA
MKIFLKRMGMTPFLKWALVCLLGLGGTHSHAAELAELLKGNDHVLLMRHALAPGVGDPAGYQLDNCKSQRNLDAQGRAQAQRIGQWLKSQGVRDALVFSSAWCRCKETAEKLGLGTPVHEAALNSFFDDMRQGPQSNAKLQKFIETQLKSKSSKALILVTHHVNIAEFMGENVGSGDMVLAKVSPQGRLLSYKIYPSP